MDESLAETDKRHNYLALHPSHFIGIPSFLYGLVTIHHWMATSYPWFHHWIVIILVMIPLYPGKVNIIPFTIISTMQTMESQYIPILISHEHITWSFPIHGVPKIIIFIDRILHLWNHHLWNPTDFPCIWTHLWKPHMFFKESWGSLYTAEVCAHGPATARPHSRRTSRPALFWTVRWT